MPWPQRGRGIFARCLVRSIFPGAHAAGKNSKVFSAAKGRRKSARGGLFLALLFAAFLTGYLMNPVGREPARSDGSASRSKAVSPYRFRDYLVDNFTLPEADSMDGSYYARMGWYVRSRESLDPWLQALLTQVEREGSGVIALCFEAQADYDGFLDALGKALDSLPFSVSYSGWCNDRQLCYYESARRN